MSILSSQVGSAESPEIAKGTICFSPKLRLHLSSELETEDKMLKGQRFAREERALLSGNKKKK